MMLPPAPHAPATRHRTEAPGAAVDLALCAALLAVDPAGLGGAVWRGPPDAARDGWLALVRRLLPGDTPWRRAPAHIDDSALLGGLDLSATLARGVAVPRAGLLEQTSGGVLLLPMAERASPALAARLATVLDDRSLLIARDLQARRVDVSLCVVALDEGLDDAECAPAALRDRLALHLRPPPHSPLGSNAAPGAPGEPHTPDTDTGAVDWRAADVEQARARLGQVRVPPEMVQALCAAAQALGVASLRAPLLALRAARAAAALAAMDEVDATHARIAARLVLGPRATQLPAEPAPAEPPPAEQAPPDAPPPDAPPPDAPTRAPPPGPPQPEPEQPHTNDAPEDTPAPELSAEELAEQVLDAARAALPDGLLAALQMGQMAQRARAAGRSGAMRQGSGRGRPVGSRRGEPAGGARLNVIETLRAAAPWQRLRQAQAPTIESTHTSTNPPARARIQVRREDFHVWRLRQRSQTTAVFVVDASGSAALHRLAEAKGAVELLLADCYVRRDQVAVIAFRGAGAELVLPPTRSLARAKRSLAALPGGGGTPLAQALDAAAQLAEQLMRRGDTPVLVLLTDGRANIARDGSPGRERAAADAMAAARQLRAAGHKGLLVDIAPQPQETARVLAQAMGALYVPLPHAAAQQVSRTVQAVMAHR